MISEKICPVCGKSFTSIQPTKKYCSPQCKKIWRKQYNHTYCQNTQYKKNHNVVYKSHKTISKEKSTKEGVKLANARKKAEQAHNERLQDQLEAKKLGLSYGQYAAWKGTDYLERWLKQFQYD